MSSRNKSQIGLQKFSNIPSAPNLANTMLSAGVLRVLVACEESQTVCKAF